MTYDPQAAQQQLNHIAHYDIELHTTSLGLLALIQAAQHLAASTPPPPHIIYITRALAQGWQALLADPTTDLGQMLAAGWQSLPHPITPEPHTQPPPDLPPPPLATEQMARLRQLLTQASRQSTFQLADHLETAFFAHSDAHPGLTHIEILAGLAHFILWTIWQIEASAQDTTGATRALLLDLLTYRLHTTTTEQSQ